MNSQVLRNYYQITYAEKDWSLFLLSHSSVDYLDESLNTFHRYYYDYKQKEHTFDTPIVFEGVTCTEDEVLEVVRYFNYKIFRYVNDPVSIPEMLIPLKGESSVETKIRRIKYAFIAGMYMGKQLGLQDDKCSNLIESIIVGAIIED